MCACRTQLLQPSRAALTTCTCIVPKPDSAFLAPLRDLNVGGARVFLGLIHPQDGIEGAKRRIGLAKRYLNDFGISAVCGFGRENPHELGNILELHKAAAGSLAM